MLSGTREEPRMSDPAKDAARDPAKTAVSPTVVKRAPRSHDEDGEGSGAPVALKQKMLPTGLSRAIVIATIVGAVIVGAASLLKDRYSILAVPNSPNGGIYRLDRMTGALKYCGATACSPITVEAK